jgi:hypothetical protein
LGAKPLFDKIRWYELAMSHTSKLFNTNQYAAQLILFYSLASIEEMIQG